MSKKTRTKKLKSLPADVNAPRTEVRANPTPRKTKAKDKPVVSASRAWVS